MTRFALTAALSLALALPLRAQSPEVDAAYQRAAMLVRDGQGAEGRRIVDSLFVRTREGTPEHAEALYWRAALATDAAQAERDYRLIIVDYPLSPRAPRALLAMAQLELTRGDRERALAHLQRLEREHPGSDVRATAAFWTARARFDMQDESRACHALDVAQRSVAAEEVELRNQIDFLASRCLGVTRDSTVGGTASPAPSAVAQRPAPSAPTSAPAGATRNAPAADRAPSAATTPAGAPRSAPFAIQLAALNTKADAEALVARLKRSDITARVVGTAKPFRVWTGSYATRAEANEALKRLKARGIDGFVVQQPASR